MLEELESKLLDVNDRIINLEVYIFEKKQELVDAFNGLCINRNTACLIYGEIKNWDISKITDLSNLFFEKSTFGNSDRDNISNWNTSNVTDMSGMFYGATDFNKDIRRWIIQIMTNVNLIFYEATGMISIYRNEISYCTPIRSPDFFNQL